VEVEEAKVVLVPQVLLQAMVEQVIILFLHGHQQLAQVQVVTTQVVVEVVSIMQLTQDQVVLVEEVLVVVIQTVVLMELLTLVVEEVVVDRLQQEVEVLEVLVVLA
jgi:hypothetical protein